MSVAAFDRQEWLAKRRTVLCGTDIAAIAGLNPWRTAMDVFMEKVGPAVEEEENEAMEWGRRLESVIAERYAEETGLELAPGGFISRDGWRGGTPDRFIVGQKKILEVKTSGVHAAKHWGESGTDQVPEYYLPQISWYMSLTDSEACDVAVLIGGQDFRTYSIPRNQDLEGVLLEIGEKFWRDHVITRVAPDLTGSESSKAYLKSIFPRSGKSLLIPSTPDLDAIALELSGINDDLKALTERKSLIENRIKFVIAENEGIAGAGWKATWKSTKDQQKIDWAAVAEELGATHDIIAKHTKTAPGPRRFLFTASTNGDMQ